MSKAFVREDEGQDDEEDLELERLPDSNVKRYITAAGFRRLEEEVARLWNDERPKITQEVADAAAQGDRSENAEYLYGKRKLRQIDRRIYYLSKLLDRLTVVLPDPAQEGRAFFGASVELEDEDGKRSVYRIVGPDETDLKIGYISVESPVGRALLGKREGEEVSVTRPKGTIEYTVNRIWYESTKVLT